jgi:hypothetical protein
MEIYLLSPLLATWAQSPSHAYFPIISNKHVELFSDIESSTVQLVDGVGV